MGIAPRFFKLTSVIGVVKGATKPSGVGSRKEPHHYRLKKPGPKSRNRETLTGRPRNKRKGGPYEKIGMRCSACDQVGLFAAKSPTRRCWFCWEEAVPKDIGETNWRGPNHVYLVERDERGLARQNDNKELLLPAPMTGWAENRCHRRRSTKVLTQENELSFEAVIGGLVTMTHRGVSLVNRIERIQRVEEQGMDA